MKTLMKAVLPTALLDGIRDINAALCARSLARLDNHRLRQVLRQNGLNAARLADFYSPLPDVERLRETQSRWNKPSELAGVRYDIDAFKRHAAHLAGAYGGEVKDLPSHQDMRARKYGPGFPIVDGLMLYCMIRDLKPRRWLEIGSGLSTAYGHFAGSKNSSEGRPLEMTCIDPFTTDALTEFPEVRAIKDEAQNADLALFDALESGDVLFIDSTHIVRVDGEVPYLVLEVLPRLKPGVIVHIHDIFFPFNIPHPAEKYIFDWAETRWPVFWNEGMLLQAFLCFNDSFEIILSNAMLRHHAEDFLKDLIEDYPPFDVDRYETHSGSIWIRRTR